MPRIFDPRELRAAERHLRRVDPVMGDVMAEVGRCRIDETPYHPALAALIYAVISQQISVAAAASIRRKFLALYGGRAPSAARLRATADDDLRAAGLSSRKLRYLKDLAAKVDDGVVRLRRLKAMTDSQVIAELTQVLGIGRWTAEVFLLFRLGRLDVLVADDLGIQDGIQQFYDLRDRPSADRVSQIAEPWRPYRSIGCWYIWHGRRTRTT